MKETRHKFSLLQKIHACFMIISLLFLTVSAPLTARSQVAENVKSGQPSGIPATPAEEESTNPFGNTTEEKVPGGGNPLEEFLHDYSEHTLLFNDHTDKFGSLEADILIDYHRELLVPPPNLF